jgi:hypothetical protein
MSAFVIMMHKLMSKIRLLLANKFNVVTKTTGVHRGLHRRFKQGVTVEQLTTIYSAADVICSLGSIRADCIYSSELDSIENT